MSAELHCVLCTEDSGKQARAVIEALVKKLMQRVDDGLPTQRLKFASPADEAGRALRGMEWVGKPVLKVALVNYLAQRLRQDHWVVLHTDGDSAWSGAAGSKNDEAVRDLFETVRRRLNREPNRLLRLVPHYSIESWLYLNDAQINAIEAANPKAAGAAAWLKSNVGDLGGYDHVVQIKDKCPLKDRFNEDLATVRWPASEAAQRSPSWAEAERTWRAHPELSTELARLTAAPWDG